MSLDMVFDDPDQMRGDREDRAVVAPDVDFGDHLSDDLLISIEVVDGDVASTVDLVQLELSGSSHHEFIRLRGNECDARVIVVGGEALRVAIESRLWCLFRNLNRHGFIAEVRSHVRVVRSRVVTVSEGKKTFGTPLILVPLRSVRVIGGIHGHGDTRSDKQCV